MKKHELREMIEKYAEEYTAWYSDDRSEHLPSSEPIITAVFDEIERHVRRAEKAIRDCEHAEEVANAFLATNGVIAL